MSTKGEPTHRGTLVCVVLKAKNLPNKKSIGKQDPYCTLQLGTNTQKTKPDKRGGQHPTWDEQLHFEIYDDMEDQLRSTTDAAGSTGSSSPKKSRSKTSKTLRVACYADDTKEPEFIGDGIVDLTDTLKSGEFDEWVTIKAKDRYAGEVYLELTFYSAAVPPKRKKRNQPAVPTGTTYGGAGTFSEDVDEYEFAPRPTQGHAPIPSYMRPETQQSLHGTGHRSSTSSGMMSSKSHAQLGNLPAMDDIPPSLRPSASMAQMDTYTPPYAPPQIQREKSPAPSSYLDQRRGSLPPSAQIYGHRLSDAAPVMAQHYQDASRYGHGHSISSSTSQQQALPQSMSIQTLRPSFSDGYDGTADDLTRPLSSMSINARPAMAEQVHPHDAYYTHAPAYPTQSSYASGPSAVPPSTSVDAFGRPAPPLHSYSAVPITGHPNSHFPAPTPPPPPNSAPPGNAYHLQGQPHWTGPPHQQSTFSPAPMLNTTMPLRRPTSAADMVSPNRPVSSSGYHALPLPPAPSVSQQQQQQQQHEQALYLQQQQQQHDQIHYQHMASSAEFMAAQQPSYPSPNAPMARPLPPTAVVPSPSPSFAPLAPSANYYPPPAQTPSHYVAPPPMMSWTINQQAAPPNSTYSSYPPPPPGPVNGDYVHAGPLQTSPSTHPGQYPPPPPMHHVDYSQQQQPYYRAPSPLPPTPTPQQQTSQVYYRPQAQHPY